jgi:hypothetical protein
VSAAGWHPDPAGVPGRLRWWDGQAWTDHTHDPAPAAPAQQPGSALDAAVVVVSPPRPAAPGCRLFELGDDRGGRLGRLVETSRGTNDSAFGAALSRAKGWQHATTRELRGSRGYPELLLAWGPKAQGVITVTLPDRREVGRFALSDGGWAVLDHEGRRLGTATSAGVSSGAEALTRVAPDGNGGWRAERLAHAAEPLRSLLAAAAVTADLLGA